MSDTSPIVVQAIVHPAEEPAIRLAAEHLSASLGAVSAATRDVRYSFLPNLGELKEGAGTSIVISSLLPEVDLYSEPWAYTARRLRETYSALVERGNAVIFLCTVLRYVGPDHADNSADARLVRIRRLNLLAAELSQEFGVYVIDIDRTLTDIGARALDTDYRLGGPHAAQSVAKCVALTLLSAGLDDFIPFEQQDAAAEIVAAYEVSRAAPAGTNMVLGGRKAIAMRAGRRTQHVVTVAHVARSDQASWLLRSLLRRQIGVGEALSRLMEAVARNGLRSSVVVLKTAIGDLLKRRSRGDR